MADECTDVQDVTNLTADDSVSTATSRLIPISSMPLNPVSYSLGSEFEAPAGK